jgi:hypothetical protein
LPAFPLLALHAPCCPFLLVCHSCLYTFLNSPPHMPTSIHRSKWLPPWHCAPW